VVSNKGNSLRTLLILSLIVTLVSSTAAAENTWRAGVARVNITPELPIWLSGYGSRNKPATTKHDDLWAKALVLEDAAGNRAAIVTMDLVGIDRALSQTVCKRIEEELKLPRSAIIHRSRRPASRPAQSGFHHSVH
jgi:hypothetical protein